MGSIKTIKKSKLTKKQKIERIDKIIQVLDNYSYRDHRGFVKSSEELNNHYWVCYAYCMLYGQTRDIVLDIPEVELIKNERSYNHTWLTDHEIRFDPEFLEENRAKESLLIKTIALEFLKHLV